MVTGGPLTIDARYNNDTDINEYRIFGKATLAGTERESIFLPLEPYASVECEFDYTSPTQGMFCDKELRPIVSD